MFFLPPRSSADGSTRRSRSLAGDPFSGTARRRRPAAFPGALTLAGGAAALVVLAADFRLVDPASGQVPAPTATPGAGPGAAGPGGRGPAAGAPPAPAVDPEGGGPAPLPEPGPPGAAPNPNLPGPANSTPPPLLLPPPPAGPAGPAALGPNPGTGTARPEPAGAPANRGPGVRGKEVISQMEQYLREQRRGETPTASTVANPDQPQIYDYDNVPLGQVLRLLAAQANVNYVEPNLPREELVSLHLSGLRPLDAFYRVAELRGFQVRIGDNDTLTLRRSDLPTPSYFVQVVYPLRYLDPTWALPTVANLLGVPIRRPDGNNVAYPTPNNNFGLPGSAATTAGAVGGANGVAGGTSYLGGGDTADSTAGDQSRPRFVPSLPIDTPLSAGGGYAESAGLPSGAGGNGPAFAGVPVPGGVGGPRPAAGALAAGGQRALFVDRARRALVVRATPDEQAMVRDYVRQLDRPEPQVLIDTRILEITAQNDDDRGFDWSQTLGINGATFKVNFNSVTGAPGIFSLYPEGVLIQYPNLQTTLRFLQAHTRVHNVSTPRIITRSGVPAAIRSVTENAVVLNAAATNSTLVAQTATLERFYTGLTIDIVPYIRRDGQLELNLNPSLSSQVGTSTGPSGQQIPIISRREVSTTVVVPNRATLALGGLMQTNTNDTTTAIPGLSRIPLVGPALFKSRVRSQQRTNLIVMVTPTIIPPHENPDLLLPKEEAQALDGSEANQAEYRFQTARRARPVAAFRDPSK